MQPKTRAAIAASDSFTRPVCRKKPSVAPLHSTKENPDEDRPADTQLHVAGRSGTNRRQTGANRWCRRRRRVPQLVGDGLEETLQIAKQMWSGNNGPYHGKHNQLEETLCNPQPLSRPQPPILIGGGGEKKTLRLVAQYADACNIFGPPDSVRAKLAVLKQHCDALGRDYGAIEKTTLGTVDLEPDKMHAKDVIAHCEALAAIGVQHAIFNMPNVHEIRPLEVFGREIIPAVAGR